jgi:hypothetical protein
MLGHANRSTYKIRRSVSELLRLKDSIHRARMAMQLRHPSQSRLLRRALLWRRTTIGPLRENCARGKYTGKKKRARSKSERSRGFPRRWKVFVPLIETINLLNKSQGTPSHWQISIEDTVLCRYSWPIGGYKSVTDYIEAAAKEGLVDVVDHWHPIQLSPGRRLETIFKGRQTYSSFFQNSSDRADIALRPQ